MFITAVFDLTTGREVCRKETAHFKEACEDYQNAIYRWRYPIIEDDPCPYDALLFMDSGDIIYGFGE